MKKKLAKMLCFVLCGVMLLPLCACGADPCDEEWLIGKTSAEIIERYGEFDHTHGDPSEDGLYRNTSCGYLTKDKRAGFFGTSPEEYYMITFDAEGRAVSIERDHLREA